MDILVALANFTVAVMAHDPSKVIIGRTNFERLNFTDDLIIIDTLSSVPYGQTDTFNGVTESMSYGVSFKSVMTLTFYGSNARDNALKFMALCKSEVAIDTANAQLFSYLFPSNITNTGLLSGVQHTEKYEVEMAVRYTYSTNVDTLYIDTAETTLLVND